MAKLPSDLIHRVKKYFVTRAQIRKELGIETEISKRLRREARELEPPHLIERRYKGQPYKVEYHIRPIRSGEKAGQIVEV